MYYVYSIKRIIGLNIIYLNTHGNITFDNMRATMSKICSCNHEMNDISKIYILHISINNLCYNISKILYDKKKIWYIHHISANFFSDENDDEFITNNMGGVGDVND